MQWLSFLNFSRLSTTFRQSSNQSNHFCCYRCLFTFSPILHSELKEENSTFPTVLFPMLLLPAITVIPRKSNSACLIFDILSMTSLISIILSTNPVRVNSFTYPISGINLEKLLSNYSRIFSTQLMLIGIFPV